MDEAAGFTSPNLMEAETNRALMSTARRLIVLADHTKWGVVGLCAIGGLEGAAALVTDSELAQEGRLALADRVGELIIAGEEDEQPVNPKHDGHGLVDGRHL
jgi:DeoR/GlpR family transcriptional regulator of sugar metabolism